MSNSNGEINVGAKEEMSSTVIWLQVAAYTGFISIAISLFSMLINNIDYSGSVWLIVSAYLAFLLLQQSQKLKEYTITNDTQAYQQSLTHENNYWLTNMILMIIGLAICVLVLLAIVVLVAIR